MFDADSLRALRIERDLPREVLAVDVGKSYHSIAAYEQGTVVPPLETVEAMAAALEVPITALLSDGGKS